MAAALVIGGIDGDSRSRDSNVGGWRASLLSRGLLLEVKVDESPPPVLPDLPPVTAPIEALPYVDTPSIGHTEGSDGVEGQFWDGYRDGGSPYPEGRIDAMVWCESRWRIDPGGYYLGLAQFDPGTWATVSTWTGLYDWRKAYHQGYNVAAWAAAVSPGTSAGWPACWWVW